MIDLSKELIFGAPTLGDIADALGCTAEDVARAVDTGAKTYQDVLDYLEVSPSPKREE